MWAWQGRRKVRKSLSKYKKCFLAFSSESELELRGQWYKWLEEKHLSKEEEKVTDSEQSQEKLSDSEQSQENLSDSEQSQE